MKSFIALQGQCDADRDEGRTAVLVQRLILQMLVRPSAVISADYQEAGSTMYASFLTSIWTVHERFCEVQSRLLSLPRCGAVCTPLPQLVLMHKTKHVQFAHPLLISTAFSHWLNRVALSSLLMAGLNMVLPSLFTSLSSSMLSHTPTARPAAMPRPMPSSHAWLAV